MSHQSKTWFSAFYFKFLLSWPAHWHLLLQSWQRILPKRSLVPVRNARVQKNDHKASRMLQSTLSQYNKLWRLDKTLTLSTPFPGTSVGKKKMGWFRRTKARNLVMTCFRFSWTCHQRQELPSLSSSETQRTQLQTWNRYCYSSSCLCQPGLEESGSYHCW